MCNDKIKFSLVFLEENKNDKDCLNVNIKNLEEIIKECKNNNSKIVELAFCEWNVYELKFILKKYKKALKELKIKKKEKKLCFKI